MFPNNRKGSSLAEVVTYIFLLILLLGSFVSVETLARSSVKHQLLQLKMNENLAQISRQFREDVQNSYRAQTKLDEFNKLHLFQAQQKIIYQVNNYGELYRYVVTRTNGTMQMQESLVSKSIAQHRFVLAPGDLVEFDFQMNVTFRNDTHGLNGSFNIKAVPRLTALGSDTPETPK